MSSPRAEAIRIAAFVAVITLVAACSNNAESPAQSSRAERPDASEEAVREGANPAASGFVQDLWVYERVATLDEQGSDVDLDDAILAALSGEPDESVELTDGLTFHRHDILDPQLIGSDRTARSDVDLVAGLLDADGDLSLSVLATPDVGTTTPIGFEDRLRIDLSFLDGATSPGAPLILDHAFLQAYGPFSSTDPDEAPLAGLQLLAHRMGQGRVQYLAGPGGGEALVFTGEIGVMVDSSGNTRSEPGSEPASVGAGPGDADFALGGGPGEPGAPAASFASRMQSTGTFGELPTKSQPMMDGFERGIQKCGSRGGFGAACLRKYMKSMHAGTRDSMKLIDCNLSPSAANCEPDPDPTTTTTTSTTSTSTTTTTTTTPTTTTTTPPPPKVCRFWCGKLTGEPHFQTFDGTSYSMQGVGEFVAAETDGLEIQVRTEQASESASSISAVAIGVDGVEVVITEDSVTLDGEALRNSELTAGASVGDATLRRSGAVVELRTRDGHTVKVLDVSGHWLDLWVDLAEDSDGWIGLLGDTNGNADDDMRTSDGTVLSQPLDVEDLYGVFAESWRVTDDTSLFHYADGDDTETFTDRDFPAEPLTIETLPTADRRWAEALCRAAGIRDEVVFDECVIDLAVTRDVGAIRSSVHSDTISGIRDGRFAPDGSTLGAADAGPTERTDHDIPPWAMTASQLRQGSEENSRHTCTPGGSLARAWGTDVYSDDSSVCTAAVHVGLFTPASGGEVLIEHLPGEDSYEATTRNGVSTASWDSWPGSFVFIGATGRPITGS